MNSCPNRNDNDTNLKKSISDFGTELLNYKKIDLIIK